MLSSDEASNALASPIFVLITHILPLVSFIITSNETVLEKGLSNYQVGSVFSDGPSHSSSQPLVSLSLRNVHSFALIFGKQVFDKSSQFTRIVLPHSLSQLWSLAKRFLLHVILVTGKEFLSGHDVEKDHSEAVGVNPLIITLILENALGCQVSDRAKNALPTAFLGGAVVVLNSLCHAKVCNFEVSDLALVINSHENVF